MKKTMPQILAAVLALPFIIACLSAQGDPPSAGRAPRFQAWLDMVDAIASKDEKQIFLKLQNDRDRDAFMAIFWRQRDPSPGTPENEYQEEIARRFDHVSRRFGRGSVRPGWMTDMGRFYMILGEPKSIERFDENPELVPIQVWYYAGSEAAGLPSYFNVTFFRARGAGEWKLYDPVLDGPAALLHMNPASVESDYSAIMAKISRIAPTLAGPALSMIPNENTAAGRPSLQSALLLGRIVESPTRMINSGYATHFLSYKGFVDMQSSVHYVQSSGLVALTWEPRSAGAFIAVTLKPKTLSLSRDPDNGQYAARFKLHVSLRQDERIVYQYAKNFSMTFSPDRVGELQKSGLVIHDAFPAVPGRYMALIFVENSDSKEFCFYERSLVVPAESPSPLLGTLLVGYKSEEQHDPLFHAYRFGDRKLYLDPDGAFGLEETPVILAGIAQVDRELWEKGRLELEVAGRNERAPWRQVRTITLRDHPYAATMSLFLPLAGMGFVPDYYRVSLRLFAASGKLAAEEESQFSISPVGRVAHAIEIYKALSSRAPLQFELIRAMQYENQDKLPEAERRLVSALALDPAAVEARLQFMRVENRLKNFAATLAASEPLRGNEKAAFDFHSLRGAALFGLEKYDAALEELQAARRLYDSDFRLLNLIGFAQLKKNRAAEALLAFSASLALLADQPDIAKLAAGLRAAAK